MVLIFLISPLGVSHVRIDGPSIVAVDNNITFSVLILNDDEVRILRMVLYVLE